MPRKTFHAVLKALSALLLLLVIAVSGLLVWVATGPREADFLTPYLEEALSPADKGFQVDIERTALHWDGWSRPVGLHAGNVRVILPQGGTQARLPEIAVGMDFSRLLLGRLAVESVAVDRPAIRLYRTDDGDIGFGIGETEEEAPPRIASFSGRALGGGWRSGTFAGLRRIEITNARLALHSGGKVLASPRSDIRITADGDGVQAELLMEALQENGNATVRLRAAMDTAMGNIGVNGSFDNLYPASLAPFLPEKAPWLERARAPFNGKIRAALTPSGGVSGGEFELTGGAGIFSYPEYFPEDLALSGAYLAGSFGGGPAAVEVREGMLDIGGGQRIGFGGEWRDAPEGPHITFRGATQGMPVRDLFRYWPKALAPETRAWVTYGVRGGQADGEVTLDIKPGMLDLPALPGEALRGTVTVKDGTVRYLPEHPLIKNIDATLHFTGDSMTMEASQAAFMKGVRASRVTVEIPDFNAPAVRTNAAFDVTAPAGDIAVFLSRPEFAFARGLHLDPERISGAVSGHVSLGVLLYEMLEDGTEKEGDIEKFDIQAEFRDIAQPGLMGRYDVAHADGALRVDNRRLEFDGAAQLQGAAAKLRIASEFADSRTAADVTFASITAAQLQALGYGVPARLEGGIGLSASLETAADATVTTARADIAPALLSVPEAGIDKPAGAPGTLNFTLREDAKTGQVSIDAFDLTAGGNYARGSAVLGKDGNLESLELERLKAGGNDLSASYERKGDVIRLAAHGRSVDVSGMSAEDEPFSQRMFDNQDVSLRFAQAILGPERAAYALNAHWRCGRERCEEAHASGSTRSRKPFLLRLYTEGGRRKVKLEADDAGDFLRALDVIDTVRGGRLTVEAAFDDRAPGNPLSGRLTIRDYSLHHAPVLAKILTLASLTGLFDVLMGNGVTFSKLAVPFTLADDVATIKDAKTYGASIGITASGTLHLGTSEVDMEGVLVPAYSVNSLLSGIPIIGDLAGGEEGLFAANYSVKGKYPDEAEVFVNPLSMLTPGFLRGLFDAPDAPEKPKEEKQKTQ